MQDGRGCLQSHASRHPEQGQDAAVGPCCHGDTTSKSCISDQVWSACSWCARGWRTWARKCAWWSRWRPCGRRSARAAAARARPPPPPDPPRDPQPLCATVDATRAQFQVRSFCEHCTPSTGDDGQPDGTGHRQFLGLPNIGQQCRLPQRARHCRRRRRARAPRRRWPPAWRPTRR